MSLDEHRQAWRSAALLVILATLLGLGSNVFRARPLPLLEELPRFFDGEVSVAQARAYQKQGYLLVDARSRQAYSLAHIDGALPAGHPLPAEARVITYCGSRLCPRAEELARALERKGLESVLVMPDGIEGWARRGYPLKEGASP